MNATGTIPHNSITHGSPRHGVLDRAALALGEALLAWADRRSRAPAVDHEQLTVLLEAHDEARRIAIDRDVAKAQSYGLIR